MYTSGSSTCNHCAGWFRRPVHRKSPLFNFELGCFAHNYRPMLFLQQILNEMSRCMQTEGAPASEQPYGGTLLYNNKNTEPLNLQYFLIMVQTPSNCFHCRMVDTDQSQIMKTVMHDDNWFSTVMRLIIRFAELLRLRNPWFPFAGRLWMHFWLCFPRTHTLNFQQAATLYTRTWVLKTFNFRWTFSQGITAKAKHHKHDIYST